MCLCHYVCHLHYNPSTHCSSRYFHPYLSSSWRGHHRKQRLKHIRHQEHLEHSWRTQSCSLRRRNQKIVTEEDIMVTDQHRGLHQWGLRWPSLHTQQFHCTMCHSRTGKRCHTDTHQSDRKELEKKQHDNSDSPDSLKSVHKLGSHEDLVFSNYVYCIGISHCFKPH